MAAGTDVVIMSNDASVDSYIKLGNTGNTSSTISLEVSQVKEAGATLLRGGAFKPRTSPYSFQGLRETGIDLLLKAKEKYE